MGMENSYTHYTLFNFYVIWMEIILSKYDKVGMGTTRPATCPIVILNCEITNFDF